jgi:ribosomal protein L34
MLFAAVILPQIDTVAGRLVIRERRRVERNASLCS